MLGPLAGKLLGFCFDSRCEEEVWDDRYDDFDEPPEGFRVDHYGLLDLKGTLMG